MAPRESENNAYSNFWVDKQTALWYVMEFLEWSIEVSSELPTYPPLSQNYHLTSHL